MTIDSRLLRSMDFRRVRSEDLLTTLPLRTSGHRACVTERTARSPIRGSADLNGVHSYVMGAFPFDPEKATEALIYVARRVRDSDMYRTLKILYLADKTHLHRYARFIFGDTHAALDHGPVPQGAYDILKFVRGSTKGGFELERARRLINLQGNAIETARDADTDVFSKTDLECLDEAIKAAGWLSFQELKDLTHDAAYKATRAYGEMDVAAIAAMAENPTELIQHLAERHPDRD